MRKSSTLSRKVHGSFLLNLLAQQNAQLYQLPLRASFCSSYEPAIPLGTEEGTPRLCAHSDLPRKPCPVCAHPPGTVPTAHTPATHRSSATQKPLFPTKHPRVSKNPSRSCKFVLKCYHVHLKKPNFSDERTLEITSLSSLKLLESYFSHTLYFSLRERLFF